MCFLETALNAGFLEKSQQKLELRNPETQKPRKPESQKARKPESQKARKPGP